MDQMYRTAVDAIKKGAPEGSMVGKTGSVTLKGNAPIINLLKELVNYNRKSGIQQIKKLSVPVIRSGSDGLKSGGFAQPSEEKIIPRLSIPASSQR